MTNECPLAQFQTYAPVPPTTSISITISRIVTPVSAFVAAVVRVEGTPSGPRRRTPVTATPALPVRHLHAGPTPADGTTI
jgi:hypothetical protein